MTMFKFITDKGNVRRPANELVDFLDAQRGNTRRIGMACNLQEDDSILIKRDGELLWCKINKVIEEDS